MRPTAGRIHIINLYGCQHAADARHRPDDLGRYLRSGSVGQPGVLDPPGRGGQAAGAQPPAAGGAAVCDPVHPGGAHLHPAAAAAHAGGGVLADTGGRSAVAGNRRERKKTRLRQVRFLSLDC